MKKKLFYAAIAITALASCSSNDYVGDKSPQVTSETVGAIHFASNTPAITRGTQEDASAATALGNKFIVWGEKNESGGTAATAANTVFHNYTVQYGASSAHTTLSNTDDWEYVGVTSYTTKLTPNAPATQSIKYWDNAASSYTFTAVSALDGDITGDKVVITKNTTGTTVFDKGYTIAVKADAHPGNIFFADRINDAPANLRNSAVKFSFRNLQAKLRFGIYETVPGYTVKIKQVKYNNAYSTANFGVDGKFIKPATNTSFTVTYGNGTTTGPLNKALVAVSADTYDSFLASTSTTIMTANAIGTSSSGATKDDYVSILPYTSNTTDLSFTIDYTLKSEDTNEIIEITGKTVKVPAAYCKWQSNYAYTYLFKITDSDLTPITFDACYVEDENGNQETITTVSEPSITTYAKGTMVTANNEYLTGANIYVVVDKNGTVETLTAGTNAKLYTATVEAGAAQGITEETVKNALVNGTQSPSGTWTVTDANSKKLVVTTANGLTATSSIPAADSPTGADITVAGAKFAPAAPTFTVVASGTSVTNGSTYYTAADGSTNVKLTADGTAGENQYWTKTATSAGYYVFEFTDTSDGNKKYYKVIKVVDQY